MGHGALASEISSGHRGAETDLVTAFSRPIRMFVLGRLDAEHVDDAVQETLSRVIAALRDGRLEHEDRLSSFVYGTARNVVLNVQRGRRRSHRALRLLDGPAHQTAFPDPLHAAITRARAVRVKACLDRLRDEDRHVLYLAFYEGLRPREIASELGIDAKAARMRKWRALKRFKDCYVQMNGIETGVDQ